MLLPSTQSSMFTLYFEYLIKTYHSILLPRIDRNHIFYLDTNVTHSVYCHCIICLQDMDSSGSLKQVQISIFKIEKIFKRSRNDLQEIYILFSDSKSKNLIDQLN